MTACTCPGKSAIYRKMNIDKHNGDGMKQTSEDDGLQPWRCSSDQYDSVGCDIYTADSVHKTKKKAGAEVYKDCKHWDHSV